MNPEPRKRKILIIDDEIANLRIMIDYLKDDYEISVSTNGPEAIEIAMSDDPPELILLDIRMPKMDGYDVCKFLRKTESTKEIPIIFVTAHTDDETLQKAFDAGGTDYVRKPVSRIEIKARMQSALTQIDLTRKLIQEEKLEGVLELAGAVCHQLSQPMQAISGFAQLLIMDTKEDDPRFEYISIIREQIEKMSAITRKLMRITRYETISYIESTKIIDIDRASEAASPAENLSQTDR